MIWFKIEVIVHRIEKREKQSVPSLRLFSCNSELETHFNFQKIPIIPKAKRHE